MAIAFIAITQARVLQQFLLAPIKVNAALLYPTLKVGGANDEF